MSSSISPGQRDRIARAARDLAAHVRVTDKRTEGYAQALKDVENDPEILLSDRDDIVSGYPFMDGYHEALAALDKAIAQ